jgi:two-component system sensor histidine kinase SenX3
MSLRRKKSIPEGAQILPVGLVEALKLLNTESMVLPATDSPASFTDGLVNYGLIRDGRIQSEDLLALIRVVRRTQTVQEKVFEFSRGPLGEATRLLKVIASGVDAEGTVLVLINDESEAERVANVL